VGSVPSYRTLVGSVPSYPRKQMSLFYLYSKSNPYPIDEFLATWGRVHILEIIPVTYEALSKKTYYPNGTYLFSDIELLNGSLQQKAMSIWNYCKEKGYASINCPDKSLKRFELLKILHKKSINPFNIYKLTDEYSLLNFPVFVRKADDHQGPQSALLHNTEQLEKVVLNLKNKNEHTDDWIITEFLDTADEKKIYRKYAAFIVNNTIVASHLYCSDQWSIKYKQSLPTEEFIKEESEYVRTNPHEQQLKKIFEMAEIEYGRVDYSIVDNKINVWEINTNPMIIALGDYNDVKRKESNLFFFNNISKHLRILCRDHKTPIYVYLPNRCRAIGRFIYSSVSISWLGKFIQRVKWKLELLAK
jgi:hypothetical protein